MKKNIIIFFIMLLFILIIGGIYYTRVYVPTSNSAKETEEYIRRTEGIKITVLGASTMESNGNVNSIGYIIRTKNNYLIIVDGGHSIDSNFVLNYINEYGNGKVDYWFFTHGHEDHVGAFVKLINELEIEMLNKYLELL